MTAVNAYAQTTIAIGFETNRLLSQQADDLRAMVNSLQTDVEKLSKVNEEQRFELLNCELLTAKK